MSQIDKQNYKAFLKEIKLKIKDSQYKALKSINKELVKLYWDLGKSIVEKQDIYHWGKSVVETLSKDIQAEFPGITGFSGRNLWYMRNFYLAYHESEFLQPLVAEISWSHNLIVIQKCKEEAERYFYISMTKRCAWSKQTLIEKIKNQEFQNYKLNQTNFDEIFPESTKKEARLTVKDEYSFGFLDLEKEHTERQLENELMKNIRRFLMEMGGDFCFIANQYKVELEGKEYFIDILLYHRQLRCLIAIELKKGDFLPEYVGKLNFYLSVLNDKVKQPEENPSIGIVICQSKNRTVVEYALKDINKPMGIAQYKVTDTLPEKLRKYLPQPDEMAEKAELLEIH